MTTARRAVVLCRPDCDNAEIERLSRAHDLRVVYTVYTDTGPELAARIAVQYALDYDAEVVVIPYLSAREAGEVPAWRTVGRIVELVTGTGVPPGSRLDSAPDRQETEVAPTTPTETTVAEVLAELADLADPKIRAVNEKHGDDHGVNLGRLRAVAKRLKTQPDLARGLWESGDTAARLLALLICRPKAFEPDELDAMLRDARTPKVQDWLVNYVVKKNPHAEELRVTWFDDSDPGVASAGWGLTADRVSKKPGGLDLPGLLDLIEARMKDAPDRLQWAMNTCLAQIGIEHPEYRARAIDIGERLKVLEDYPTSPGCTSPFAPIWITEMVRRQKEK
jgi:3-methyladenine DNA glycosylase AlkD